MQIALRCTTKSKLVNKIKNADWPLAACPIDFNGSQFDEIHIFLPNFVLGNGSRKLEIHVCRFKIHIYIYVYTKNVAYCDILTHINVDQ